MRLLDEEEGEGRGGECDASASGATSAASAIEDCLCAAVSSWAVCSATIALCFSIFTTPTSLHRPLPSAVNEGERGILGSYTILSLLLVPVVAIVVRCCVETGRATAGSRDGQCCSDHAGNAPSLFMPLPAICGPQPLLGLATSALARLAKSLVSSPVVRTWLEPRRGLPVRRVCPGLQVPWLLASKRSSFARRVARRKRTCGVPRVAVRREWQQGVGVVLDTARFATVTRCLTCRLD